MHELISIFRTDHNFANLLNPAQCEPLSHDGQMNKLHRYMYPPNIWEKYIADPLWPYESLFWPFGRLAISFHLVAHIAAVHWSVGGSSGRSEFWTSIALTLASFLKTYILCWKEYTNQQVAIFGQTKEVISPLKASRLHKTKPSKAEAQNNTRS